MAKKDNKKQSTGSPTVDAANAAKKFKAPKDYKPLSTVEKASMAASVVPTGKLVKTAAQVASRVTARKMVPTEAKTVIRKFTQGKKANIVEQAPKKYNQGPKSPVKGTKVTVEKQTKGQSPLQQTTFTTGATVRKKGSRLANQVQGAARLKAAETVVNKNADSKKKDKK